MTAERWHVLIVHVQTWTAVAVVRGRGSNPRDTRVPQWDNESHTSSVTAAYVFTFRTFNIVLNHRSSLSSSREPSHWSHNPALSSKCLFHLKPIPTLIHWNPWAAITHIHHQLPCTEHNLWFKWPLLNTVFYFLEDTDTQTFMVLSLWSCLSINRGHSEDTSSAPPRRGTPANRSKSTRLSRLPPAHQNENRCRLFPWRQLMNRSDIIDCTNRCEEIACSSSSSSNQILVERCAIEWNVGRACVFVCVCVCLCVFLLAH